MSPNSYETFKDCHKEEQRPKSNYYLRIKDCHKESCEKIAFGYDPKSDGRSRIVHLARKLLIKKFLPPN